jgi:hypothetical protein
MIAVLNRPIMPTIARIIVDSVIISNQREKEIECLMVVDIMGKIEKGIVTVHECDQYTEG